MESTVYKGSHNLAEMLLPAINNADTLSERRKRRELKISKDGSLQLKEMSANTPHVALSASS